MKPAPTKIRAISSEALAVTFVTVTEDYRCPRDVVCIQAGQATIVFRVEIDSFDLGDYPLTLGAGQRDESNLRVEGYTIKLARLNPYPLNSKPNEPNDYLAYFAVAKG